MVYRRLFIVVQKVRNFDLTPFFLFFCFCFVDLVVEAESSPTGGKLMQSIHNLKEKKTLTK